MFFAILEDGCYYYVHLKMHYLCTMGLSTLPKSPRWLPEEPEFEPTEACTELNTELSVLITTLWKSSFVLLNKKSEYYLPIPIPTQFQVEITEKEYCYTLT